MAALADNRVDGEEAEVNNERVGEREREGESRRQSSSHTSDALNDDSVHPITGNVSHVPQDGVRNVFLRNRSDAARLVGVNCLCDTI